jgi:hypothetical protein
VINNDFERTFCRPDGPTVALQHSEPKRVRVNESTVFGLNPADLIAIKKRRNAGIATNC